MNVPLTHQTICITVVLEGVTLGTRAHLQVTTSEEWKLVPRKTSIYTMSTQFIHKRTTD